MASRKKYRIGGARRLAIHLRGTPLVTGAEVRVLEAVTPKARRMKDRFGTWTTSRSPARLRVEYQGRDYWIDEDLLEPESV